MALLLTTDATRGVAMGWSRETGLIEWLTAVLMLGGGAWGVYLSWKRWRGGNRAWRFFLAISLLMLLVGMEEIAWGQKVFEFETPKAIADLNEQGDLTLHNLPGLHGHSDKMWLTFGLAGLIGIALGRQGRLRHIAPPAMLTPWFLIIIGIAVPLIWRDYSQTDNRLILLFDRMDEFNELLIAMTCCLYLWFCAHKQPDRQPAVTSGTTTH